MKKILIVDDEDINLLLLHGMITKLLVDVKITEATNGIDAIELCKENDFDIIFMDIKMPTMTGVEATIKIREINKVFTPLIISATAYYISEIKDYDLAKFDGYIQKPIFETDLNRTLESVLKYKRTPFD